MSSNIRRQIAGLSARFLPPGHSSSVNSMGQFSMPIRTSRSSAYFTSGFQTFRNRGQFSSTDLVQSRPMKVVTRPTRSRAAAWITFLKWASTARASSASGLR